MINNYRKIFIGCLIFSAVLAWFYFDFPHSDFTWLRIEIAKALNKTNNYNFSGSATGWTIKNDATGTDVCGSTTSTTEGAGFSQATYDSGVGNLAGSFRFRNSDTGNNVIRKGQIYQTFTAPGSGNVKVAGKFDYYAVGTSWNGTAATSWLRVDIYDSTNSTYVGNIGCASFNSNQAWTTTSWNNSITLTGGTTYTIRVTARNQNTVANGTNDLHGDNIVVNSAPTGLAVATTDTPTLSLSWSTSTGGTGAPALSTYKVYRNTSSPVATADFIGNSPTTASSDATVIGNTTYYYAITDYDASGDTSPLSAEVSILTVPGTPDTPTFSNINSTTLTVNWGAPAGGATYYKIERCQGAACSDFSQIATDDASPYNDSGLTASTTYRYRIRGWNASGNGPYSSIASVTTSAPAAPAKNTLRTLIIRGGLRIRQMLRIR